VENPQTSFDHAQQALQQGDLVRAQSEAEDGLKRYLAASPEWARKFQILDAEVVLVRGTDYWQVLTILDAEPDFQDARDSVIKILVLRSAALARLGKFHDADLKLRKAEALCVPPQQVNCGDVLRARGVFLLEEGQPAKAKHLFEQAAAFAQDHDDRFLEATSELNLGLESLREQHYDEAVYWTDAAYRTASALDARVIAEKARGNLGWAYYYLGDSERSLEISLEAEKLAAQAGSDTDRLTWIRAAGNVYANRGDFVDATRSYQGVLDLAEKTNGQEAIYDAYLALALVSVKDGELEDARKYSDGAIEIAHIDKNRLEELYPLLVKGLIAARSHHPTEAEDIFHKVALRGKGNALLKFQSQYALARLYEDQGRFAAANREYQTALRTIEVSRSKLKRLESKLPFSNNARNVYDDYIHFLVANDKSDEALRRADFSRARTLAEGLGLLGKGGSVRPPPLDARQIARSADGTLLFYWLGEKQSYLWVITKQKTSLFTLPAGKKIDNAVQGYRAVLGVQDAVASAEGDGQALYQMLIGPAQELLKKDAKVFVISDGNLNHLNFETLIVSESKGSAPKAPAPKWHYWIEDVTIANAGSLRVLAAVRAGKQKHRRTLLIVGDSVAPNIKYPRLPKAAAQMESVESHFSATEQKILTQERATPSAYLASRPEQFSYIHFVAHGTASQLSPLDSAIVLSKDGAQDNSFKLYARDIVSYRKQHPLQAELVTISACYSAGETPYSGEGLVGLSWAFLNAGAHNVVAALWEVSDESTLQLMDKFYGELNKGASPDGALRTAKLSLLRGGKKLQKPFYWAPFQLYARLG